MDAVGPFVCRCLHADVRPDISKGSDLRLAPAREVVPVASKDVVGVSFTDTRFQGALVKLLRKHDETEPSTDADPVEQSSSDELDVLVRTTRPRTWTALALTGAVLAAIVVWSFVATVPQTETLQGRISTQQPAEQVTSEVGGLIVSISAFPGQVLRAGDPLVTIRSPNGKTTTQEMPWTGQVWQVPVLPGQPVRPGTQLAVVLPEVSGQPLFGIFYVSPTEAQGFQKGQQVEVTLASSGDSMVGVVESVALIPSGLVEITETLGDRDVANHVFTSADNSPMALIVALGSDPKWATPGVTGRPPSPADVTMTIVTADPHPIELVLNQ